MKNVYTLVFAVIFALIVGHIYKSWNVASFGFFIGVLIGDIISDIIFKKIS